VAPDDRKADRSFNERFCLATKQARKNAHLTAVQMAERLDISVKTYNQYEYKTPLPQALIARFCMLANITIGELFDRANNPRA
jgi:DNA-binding XRE family transcriptional regulator